MLPVIIPVEDQMTRPSDKYRMPMHLLVDHMAFQTPTQEDGMLEYLARFLARDANPRGPMCLAVITSEDAVTC